MTLYRKLFDPRFISAEDLDGREVTLTIAGVEKCKDIHNMQTQKEEEKPIIVFTETHKTGKLAGQPIKMVLNITNAKKIAELYGRHFEQWVGKRITIYPVAIKAFKTTLDAIRVKKPAALPASAPATTAAPQLKQIEYDNEQVEGQS